MSASGNGNGGADGARPSLEEVLASFEPRDRLEHLAALTASQFSELTQVFKSQSDAMAQAIQVLADQVLALGTEVARLKAQQDAPSEDQVTLQ
jgi:hypothetical protein